MSAGRLRRVGWGRLRQHFPERGPIGQEWVDAEAVIAVVAAPSDAHYRERCRLELCSGGHVTVFGKPDEVVAQLA